MSIYKKGNKYHIRFRLNKKRYRLVSPDNSMAGAKAYEAQLRQNIANNEPINTVIKANDVLTLKEFAPKWFDVYVQTNNKPSEYKNKKSIFNSHLLPFFGNKHLSKITSLDIEEFKAKEKKAGLSNKSVNNFLVALSKCLKTANEWGVIEKVPFLKLLKVAPQKFDFLTEKEIQLLLDNSEGQTRDMIQFALNTGLRFGELIALQYSDIDFINNFMTINKSICRKIIGSTKGNNIRYIPLSNVVIQILANRDRKNGFIFSKGDNEPLSQFTCLKQLHRACESAGMRRLGWHILRHTFASRLSQNDVSVMATQKLLGHSDIKTTMRYSHLTSAETEKAIATLN